MPRASEGARHVLPWFAAKNRGCGKTGQFFRKFFQKECLMSQKSRIECRIMEA